MASKLPRNMTKLMRLFNIPNERTATASHDKQMENRKISNRAKNKQARKARRKNR